MRSSIDLCTLRGFETLWAQLTFREPRAVPRDQRERMLLDALGLGIEQATLYLGRERPDLVTFAAWVLATAGPPDPVAIARYHAWLDGVPPPPAAQVRIDAIAAAPDVLDADDLAHWDREGWVILRNAVNRQEAAAAEALLWRILDADPDDPATWYGHELNGIMVQHFQDAALDVARRSPRIHKAFAQLWGRADLWSAVDRMSFNPPEIAGRPFQGPRMHWDVSLSLPIPFATQGILYLTDTAADQGAFALLPGFHHRLEAWLEQIGDADPRLIHLDPQAIPIAAGAGDLVIWRQDLPHGASPNRSTRPRMAQYVNFYSPELKVHRDWR
ncbi:phytanoyl-CoA dioxygenase [Sphingomonas suaedae]|uniref:Phytanoyl-CoA dioxygenase n=1 Tax=Sphingomonas suaedae TaxID=2599297 RepID=A0A518RBU1_9SPHN|nr:phytanoyl-CoA dioxygenase family protein [Sphingomonas suaedae]QDX24942.1 phytanoyl-CoA dioxygenase [Sphingomonas suaedae]